MPNPPCKFSPIFMDFSNAQLLIKHTTGCCTENAKPRGKCDWFLLHCHSTTTHHLFAMKITDCMLSIHCKLIFLSLSTLHHYKIYCFWYPVNPIQFLWSISAKHWNQITLNNHPILIESTAQLLSETYHSSHFYSISSKYTIQSLTTQNCNENHPEQLQITAIHSSNHSQFTHP